ncbi:MAG: ABC transporter ATP-binding protein [bacterium]|nr:ABC transporter ATP-binding protein [bacterium]
MKLTLKGVYKYWETESGKVRVLDNVNFSLNTGDFIAIMGPSGTGKSTMLHLLGCIDKPNMGSILFDDTDICALNESAREIIRLKHIGFVFQNYYLIPTLSVIENVMLPLQLANAPGNHLEKAYRMIELVGMESKINENTSKLSGGQRQRVSIARALVNDPILLLADEPTGNLDTKTTREIMDMIRLVNKEKKITTVMVTHDTKVAQYADRVYYLDEGRISSANL